MSIYLLKEQLNKILYKTIVSIEIIFEKRYNIK